MTTVKPSDKLTFRDLLSQLTFNQSCKLLGDEGKKLILRAAHREIDVREHVRMKHDEMQVTFLAPNGEVEAITTLTKRSDAKDRLYWSCENCDGACEHVGAMFSLVLENKTQLGLAAPPDEREPVAELSAEEVIRQALHERRERSKAERMKIKTTDCEIAVDGLHGHQPAERQDLSRGAAGTGAGRLVLLLPRFSHQHAGHLQAHDEGHRGRQEAILGARTQAAVSPQANRRASALRRRGHAARCRAGAAAAGSGRNRPAADRTGRSPTFRICCAGCASWTGSNRVITSIPTPRSSSSSGCTRTRIRDKVAEIRRDPANHPLRTTLLKTAAACRISSTASPSPSGAGRAVLADDMGLGKTIQGVGVAELLAREAEHPQGAGHLPRVAQVAVAERNPPLLRPRRAARRRPHRRADRAVQQRRASSPICNYEQVLRDILSIEQAPWDLIILDEGQRIKNWEAKTSRVIKGLKSRFALVLSGTPLENRLDDLYSVVQFVDDRRLGPGFRFFNQHRMVDEKGKVLGYKNLDELREQLQPILLRRTRDSRAAGAARANDRDRPHPADRRADGAARRAHADRGHDRRARSSSPRWTCCGCGRRC